MDSIVKKHKMKVIDMTEGNPIRLILTFAIPLFIGNIFQQVYSMVDTIWVIMRLRLSEQNLRSMRY